MPETKIKEELCKGADISIITLVDLLIEQARDMRASDIHIDPSDAGMRVRFRIDGILQDAHLCPKEVRSEIIARIKVLAGLRTDEHQTAQDGRFRVNSEKGGSIDIRVSIIPTYHGENAVLRLLTDKANEFSLDALGFSKPDQQKILKALKKPSGMILSTGPTGSGKTTTLYTLIKKLYNPEVSIITIEDPIEYAMPDIEQIQVNVRAGLTFANGLRSILRQDPNVIMVGEIRDGETAGIAVNTALTGHLLLSTLHTNDAATTLPRLLDMGVEPFLIASTVNIAIGQRLVRKICPKCKKTKKLSDLEKESLSEGLPASISLENKEIYYGAGCDACGNTGYKGRIGINEVLSVNDEIREAILRKASASEIKQISRKNGMTTMMEDGINKAEEGLTTIEEVLRVVNE